MAYNQSAAYEPPRRPYYGQQQPPAQNGYGNGYNECDQQYYDQEYDYGQSYGYEHSAQPSQRSRIHQYQDGYGRQPNSYGQEQAEPRQYDPRYRQRPERTRQQDYGQGSRQHRTHQSPPGGEQPQQRQRPNPAAARFHSPEMQPTQQPRQVMQQAPQKAVDSRPRTAPQAQKQPDPSKMSMEEWKAREKARMHAAALSPEVLAQDNAFPVFPTYQNRSRPGTANGTEEAGSPKSIERANGDRPALSRDNSHDNREAMSSPQQTLQRPAVEHQPFSFDPIQSRPPANGTTSSPEQQRPQLRRADSNMAPMPVEHELSWQQPAPELRQSPPNTQYANRAPPPQADSRYDQYGYDDRMRNEQYTQQPRQVHPRGPPMQPINTAPLPQPPRPGYMDHQPLSPAIVPPRPSSAQGTQQRQPVVSPMSTYSQRMPSNARSHSDPRVPAPVPAAPISRAQEIEAEMPDFDSAAPGGTSLLHKRSQVKKPDPAPVELPTTARTPTPQQGLDQPPLPGPNQRFYGQPHDVRSNSLPDHRLPKQREDGITDGYVFEVPGEIQYDERHQQVPPQADYPPQQGQRFQPPYAREQLPRRSMDDGRTVPSRQGHPQPQRFPPNGRPPRGPYPPQRPPVDRNMSAQTASSDPFPDRGGSAPPRQAMRGPPPGAAMGTPLSQQRSAPDQPGQTQRHSNPDALPHHPAPVRPGLMDGGPGAGLGPGSKPPPVRNYNGAQPSQHQRQVSLDQATKPITPAELDRLRAAVNANPNNHKQALLLAKKLVEAGTVLASEGGRVDQRTTAKNRERYIMDAHKLVKKLVAAGYPDAQFYLADCYGSGELGLEVDPREAFKLYQAAAKAGHGEAAYRTAMCCEMGPEEGGGTSKDYAKAVQWYKRAATLGDPAGMFKTGVILLKGLLGQQRNVGEAVTWLKRSVQNAGQDNPHALLELGYLYESANTNPEVRNKVVADDAYALELFERAAKLGNKSAQFRLGQAYEYGQMGLTMDNRTSISWYSKAAAQGEHQAELALSGWYLTGAEGILEHSDMEAYLWARKAASSEPPLAKAMFAMGYFTETGIGCPASIDEAKKWYGRAASYNLPKARERLEELRRNPHKGARQPANGKLTRNQKKDESECAVM